MPRTVVGLFTTPAEAAQVKQLLVQEGYSPASIRVLSNESNGFAEGTVTGSAATPSGDTGVLGSIKNFFRSFTTSNETEQDYYTHGVSAGGALLAITTPDEQVESVTALLEAHGAQDVNEEASASGAQAAYATSGAATTTKVNSAIPIVEEELQVGKRQVRRGGVRVYSHLVETPVEESVQLREEHIRIDRQPVNRPVSAADLDTFKEGTFELTETAEEVVVAKQARVVEEVRVGKDVTERTQQVKDSVRHTEVEVEEIPGERSYDSKSAGKL